MKQLVPIMRAIEFQKVSKEDTYVSLKEVSFAAQSGEVTCLTGPPGSGKGTIVSIIAGLTSIDTGMVRVLGMDPFSSMRLSRGCALVSGRHSLPSNLYMDDMLVHASRLYGFTRDDAREALRLLDLWNERHLRISRIPSHKVEIAKFLLPICRRPELMIVDCMDKALDASQLSFIYSCLADIVRSKASTLFITTSDRRSVEDFANSFVRIRDGNVKSELSLSAGDNRSGSRLRIRVSDVVLASMVLNAVGVEGGSVLIREPPDGISSAIALLEEKGVRIKSIERVGEEFSVGEDENTSAS